MDTTQFALVKQLFVLVCDLPEPARLAALRTQTDDTEVIDEVMALASQAEVRTAQFATPVFTALARMVQQPLQTGDILGAWTLIAEIGEGGMGKVFRARRSDGHFEQIAAIKLLAGFASKEALTYLARERQILASLSHPNIARLFDGGSTTDGQPYLVMEYVDGLPIDQYCRQHKLSRAAILKLFMVACQAVAFAHQRLVVHCDLKPSNILVSPEGRVILLDFGVSRLLNTVSVDSAGMTDRPTTVVDAVLNAAGGNTVAGVAGVGAASGATGVGFTPRYASPEQKSRSYIGTATDIYSLGLMLAELLGVDLTPVAAPSPSPAPAPPSPLSATTLATLPADLAAILKRASAAAPGDRYTDANALAADLQRFLEHRPVAARPATRAYIISKLLRREWPLALAALALMVTVAGFSWRTVIERDNALAAERATREVKDYMISVFQGADPEVSGQRDLPVSALLDAGHERLALQLQDLPKTRVEMTSILGSVYQSISKREQALKMFDEAIALERSLDRAPSQIRRSPGQPNVLANLLYKKAYTVYDMEDYVRAEAMLRELVTMLDAASPGSAELFNPLRLLGVVLAVQGNTDAARPFLDRAQVLAQQKFADNSIEAAKLHLDFARYHVQMDGGWREGEGHARNAMRIFAEKLGREHNLYVDSLEILVLALGSSGRYEEGIPLAREMSEKRAKLYGEFSNQNSFGIFGYARMLMRAGRRLEAMPLFERCLVIQEKIDGRATLGAVQPMLNLAELKLLAGDYASALALANEVREIHRKLLPAPSQDTLYAQFIAGRAERLLGRLTDAERTTADVLAEREKNTTTAAWRIVQSRLELAAVYRVLKKFDQADTLLTAISTEAAAKAPERAGQIVAEQARVAQANGKFDDALKLFLDAEALYSQGNGDNHPDSWLAKIDRAELLAKRGQRAAAQTLAREIASHVKAAIDANGQIAQQLARLQA